MLTKVLVLVFISIALQSCLAKSYYSADKDDDDDSNEIYKPSYKTNQFSSKSYGKSHGYEDSDDLYGSNAYNNDDDDDDDSYRSTRRKPYGVDDDDSYSNSYSNGKSYDKDSDSSGYKTPRKSVK